MLNITHHTYNNEIQNNKKNSITIFSNILQHVVIRTITARNYHAIEISAGLISMNWQQEQKICGPITSHLQVIPQ
jgi:hypothetical protein